MDTQTDARTLYGRTMDATELLSMEFEQHWLIEGLLPPEGRLLVVAPGKTGKSIFVMDLCHAAVLGIPFLDFQIVRPLRVHYIDFEVGSIMFQDRLRKMAEVYNLPADRFFVTSFPETLDAALDAVSDIDLFVVDPAIALRYADENNNAAIRMMLDDLHAKCRARGAAVILVHHTRKQGRDGATRNRGLEEARGAGAFVDWMDAGIYLREVTKGQSYELQFKLRGAEDPPDLTVHRDALSLTYSLPEGILTFEQAASRAEREWRENNPAAHTSISQSDLARKIMEMTGKGRSTVYRWLQQNRPAS